MKLILLQLLYLVAIIGTGFFLFLSGLAITNPRNLKLDMKDKEKQNRSKIILIANFLIYLFLTFLINYFIRRKKLNEFNNINEVELGPSSKTFSNKLE